MKTVTIKNLLTIEPSLLLKGLKKPLNVMWDDGITVEMTSKEVILNCYILQAINNIDIPITSDMAINKYFVQGIYVSNSINKLYSLIFKKIVNTLVKPSQSRYYSRLFFQQAQQAVNRIYNELVYDIQEYVTSFNILDFIEVQVKEPLLEAMLELKRKNSFENINKAGLVLGDILTNDPTLKNNKVSKGWVTGTYSQNQVKQILGPRGFVTEINNKLFNKPAVNSFCLGLNNIYEMAIESRSAAKALFVSLKAIRDSEYTAREMQLVAMNVERLVLCDCGSKDYFDFYVRGGVDNMKEDLPNLVGKYYLDEATGEEKEITILDKHLENTTIKLRNVQGCQLRDKRAICVKCFGALGYSLHDHTNIGHFCTVSVTERISQNILSTKHLNISAVASSVVLTSLAAMFFTIKDGVNYVYNFKEFKKQGVTVKLAISQYQAQGLKDLDRTVNLDKSYASKFSYIREIFIRIEKEDGTVEEVPIEIKRNKLVGWFSGEFLKYIKDTGYILDNLDRYVIDLSNWKSTNPMIETPRAEFSFSDLLAEFKALFKSKSRDDMSIETFIQTVFDLINRKLDINLSIIETVVYGFTVADRNNRDFRLGRFSPNKSVSCITEIMPNRSAGGLYAWEHVKEHSLSPKSFYGENSVDHIMDVMVRPQQVIADLRSLNG